MSKREAALKEALDDYWNAHCHDDEHRAVQRLIALGDDADGCQPCPEPECVALRQATIAVTEEGPDISDITRAVARGC
jgi:hypothetical protein